MIADNLSSERRVNSQSGRESSQRIGFGRTATSTTAIWLQIVPDSADFKARQAAALSEARVEETWTKLLQAIDDLARHRSQFDMLREGADDIEAAGAPAASVPPYVIARWATLATRVGTQGS